jgi:hypothetical protein
MSSSSTSEKLFVTAFKEVFLSWFPKNPIIIPQADHQALGMCFFMGFLRFNPPLFDYSRSPSTWDLQLSFESQLAVSTRKWVSWFRLGGV